MIREAGGKGLPALLGLGRGSAVQPSSRDGFKVRVLERRGRLAKQVSPRGGTRCRRTSWPKRLVTLSLRIFLLIILATAEAMLASLCGWWIGMMDRGGRGKKKNVDAAGRGERGLYGRYLGTLALGSAGSELLAAVLRERSIGGEVAVACFKRRCSLSRYFILEHSRKPWARPLEERGKGSGRGPDGVHDGQ